MPQKALPIVMIGAGGIVKGAHLPAYRKAGWKVEGIYDVQRDRAAELAAAFGIGRVFDSLEQAVQESPARTIFDVAVPASNLVEVLRQFPEGSVVMMQKPMGENIEEAKKILKLCRDKRLVAAVNFQMRFIPAVVAAKNIIDAGYIGQLHDMEIRMNIFHPWHLWEFLFHIPRMEMLYHSIHYMDLLRYFFGNPKGVYARTLKHPNMMQLASTRSVILLEYDNIIKAHINTNHGHAFGEKYQDSFIKFEGTKGAIKTTLGLNINYPVGVEDSFEYCLPEEGRRPEWISVDIRESWFPDAFLGSMANLQCYAEGSSRQLINHVDSAFQTMQVVEAAYQSSDGGGTLIDYRDDAI